MQGAGHNCTNNLHKTINIYFTEQKLNGYFIKFKSNGMEFFLCFSYIKIINTSTYEFNLFKF